jgi:hypothetical protein
MMAPSSRRAKRRWNGPPREGLGTLAAVNAWKIAAPGASNSNWILGVLVGSSVTAIARVKCAPVTAGGVCSRLSRKYSKPLAARSSASNYRLLHGRLINNNPPCETASGR